MLSHPGEMVLQNTAHAYGSKLKSNKDKCEDCATSKARRSNVSKAQSEKKRLASWDPPPPNVRRTRNQTRLANAYSESGRENDGRVRFSADLLIFNRRTKQQKGSDEEDIETDDEENTMPLKTILQIQ